MPKDDKPSKITYASFLSGESLDYKNGGVGGFYSGEALDFRQKASQMSTLPGARALSTGLSDLPTVMQQTPDGVRYMVGNAGYIYRVSATNAVSQLGKLNSNGGAGLAYNQQSDNLYMSDQHSVSIYGQIVAGNPKLLSSNFGPSASVAPGVIYTYDTTTLSYDGANSTQRNNLNTLTATGVTPTNYAGIVTNSLTETYILPSAISEQLTQYCPFIPDIEPFYGVAVWVTAIGTGNWTLTMHDSLNNNLGAVTITNANMVVGWNLFKFTSPGIRAIINPIANGTGSGNHFHLTSSVSADTAACATINSLDLTGCNFVLFAYRLVQTNNGWHPMANFNQYLVVGNGQYLSTYNYANDANPNNTQWVRHQLQLDYGYEVCGLSVNNQQLVIAAEKRSTNSSRNYQDGYLYIWDGINATFNQKIEIPMGAPYSLSSYNGVTYFICAGSLFAWGGGSQVYKVRYIGYQNTDYLGSADSTIVNPNMMDLRYNLLLIGYPSSTTNINLKYGVYSWGSVELTYPNSFGYQYALSQAPTLGLYNDSGTGYSGLQMGLIKNFVDSLYISWQYTDSASVVHYGLDVVDNFSTPATNFNWQSLIWDGGVRWKIKKGFRVKINFLPLPAGVTLYVNYTLDRGTTVTSSNSANAGDTSIVIEIDSNFYEIQYGFSGTYTTGTLPVTITGVATEIDTLADAQDLRADDIPESSSEAD